MGMNGFSSSAMVFEVGSEVAVVVVECGTLFGVSLFNVRFEVAFSKAPVDVEVRAGKAGVVDEDAV